VVCIKYLKRLTFKGEFVALDFVREGIHARQELMQCAEQRAEQRAVVYLLSAELAVSNNKPKGLLSGKEVSHAIPASYCLPYKDFLLAIDGVFITLIAV
jgi:hypothetical protein